MIRECDSSRCRRIYVSADTDPDGRCPTCRQGMAPLSTLRDGKPDPEGLTSRSPLDSRDTLDRCSK